MQEGASSWNLIWLLVDGVRSYHCPDDELGLGRLDVMDRFAERALEFTTMVTVAPSTVMSLSSMFTSVPSHLLSRSFEAFRYDQGEFRNIGSLLAEAGYERFAVSFYREARRYFREILKPVPARFLPSGARSWEHWDGATVETAATSVLRSSLPEPVFTFIHINGRRDPAVSDRVARLLNVIEERGLYERSVVVMCSDHGFPDPSRKSFNELIKRRGPFYNRHDLILTDDNVLVPFLLWYPGCRPKKIDEMVSTLDVAPTLLDLLGLSGQRRRLVEDGAPRVQGRSLAHLLEGRAQEESIASGAHTGDERVVRIDARYMAQDHRVSGLRGRRFKYVLYHGLEDSAREEFYDLLNDPEETVNLIQGGDVEEISDVLERYRRLFRESEESAIEYQRQYLAQRCGEELPKALGSDGLTRVEEAIAFINNSGREAELIEWGLREGLDRMGIEFTRVSLTGNERLDFRLWLRVLKAPRGSRVLIVAYDAAFGSGRIGNRILLHLLAMCHPRFYIDINMELRRATLGRRARRLWYRFQDRRDVYRAHPSFFFRDCWRLLRGRVYT